MRRGEPDGGPTGSLAPATRAPARPTDTRREPPTHYYSLRDLCRAILEVAKCDTSKIIDVLFTKHTTLSVNANSPEGLYVELGGSKDEC